MVRLMESVWWRLDDKSLILFRMIYALASKSLETDETSVALLHAARNTCFNFFLSARVEQHTHEARVLKCKRVKLEGEVIFHEDTLDGGTSSQGASDRQRVAQCDIDQFE